MLNFIGCGRLFFQIPSCGAPKINVCNGNCLGLLKNDKKQATNKKWVDDGTEFLGAFKTCHATNKEFIYSAHLVQKVCIRRAEHSITKNIIYKYLEKNWTYSYIDKLDHFV